MYFSCLLYAACAETNVHVAITVLNRTKIDEHLQVILTRVLQRQNCTKMTHARITMCILTFSSVLPAQKRCVLQPLSRFQGGKSPPNSGANLPHQRRSLRVRTDGFLYKLFNILDGNILRCVEIRITGIAAFHALKYFLLGTVFRSNMAAPAAPL